MQIRTVNYIVYGIKTKVEETIVGQAMLMDYFRIKSSSKMHYILLCGGVGEFLVKAEYDTRTWKEIHEHYTLVMSIMKVFTNTTIRRDIQTCNIETGVVTTYKDVPDLVRKTNLSYTTVMYSYIPKFYIDGKTLIKLGYDGRSWVEVYKDVLRIAEKSGKPSRKGNASIPNKTDFDHFYKLVNSGKVVQPPVKANMVTDGVSPHFTRFADQSIGEEIQSTAVIHSSMANEEKSEQKATPPKRIVTTASVAKAGATKGVVAMQNTSMGVRVTTDSPVSSDKDDTIDVNCENTSTKVLQENGPTLYFKTIVDTAYTFSLDVQVIQEYLNKPHTDYYGFQFRKHEDKTKYISKSEAKKIIAEEKRLAEIERLKAMEEEEVVVMTDLHGNCVPVNSLEAVADRLNTDVANISKHLMSGEMYKGFTFMYRKRKDIPKNDSKAPAAPAKSDVAVSKEVFETVGVVLCRLSNGHIIDYKNIPTAAFATKLKVEDLTDVIMNRTQLLNNMLWKLKGDTTPWHNFKYTPVTTTIKSTKNK